RPGDDLDVDDERLELTRFRLLGTGYFSDVQLSLSKGPRRGVVILNIDVVERNTIVINDLWLGLGADATPNGSSRPFTAFGGVDVAENNFYGTGISIGAAFAMADKQQAYRLRFADPSFLGSKWIVSTSLLYNNARDFLGTRDVLFDAPPGELPFTDYAIVRYTRTGGEVGAGLDISTSARLRANYHLEVINALLPLAASHRRGLDVEPISFHLIGGRSILSYLSVQLDDDTRDDPILPTQGHFVQLGSDFGLPSLGSDYSFLRLQARAQQWWTLPWKEHVVRLDVFGGAVFGESPLFMKFYVGDLSDFLPDRALDLNFDRRPPPNFLGTNIVEMRYEDIAFRLNGEYRIPIYRGHRSIYGVDFFGSAGIFALASQRDFKDPARGYRGFSRVPMDLTFNVGVRMQTSAGGFAFALSNAIGFFPIRNEARP
ncbi:MAG: BamA/TamA family outer membrane protein, partial [Polyangiales bacterium]